MQSRVDSPRFIFIYIPKTTGRVLRDSFPCSLRTDPMHRLDGFSVSAENNISLLLEVWFARPAGGDNE
jgi:hypothetical protein